MKGIAAAAAALLLLSSCATYTIADGYSHIDVPETTGRPETRYAIILQENAEKSAEAIENAKKEAEHRAAMRRDAAVNEYPEELSSLKYPHIYTPLKTNATAADGINIIQVLFLPLGTEPMSADDAERILSANSDLSPDFVILTGSLENQVLGARSAGWDAVTLRGGTVLHRPLLKEADENTAAFFITTTKDFDITPLYFQSSMPAEDEEAEEWALSLTADCTERDAVKAAVEAMDDSERIIALSSAAPSGDDWIEFTPFRYRSDLSFPVSDYFNSEGWLDAYRSTHFSAETDGGITHRNGEMYERLDFIWTDGMIPISAISYPVRGLTDRTGTFAVLAELLIP